MPQTLAARFLTRSDQVTDFVVHKGNGVKGLSETGIKILPDQYIQVMIFQVMLLKNGVSFKWSTMAFQWKFLRIWKQRLTDSSVYL